MDVQNFAGQSGGHYTARKILGRGTFGLVYLVEDHAGNRFALKVMSATTPALEASFKQEIASTSGLDHVNLLKVLDVGAAEFEDTPAFFAVTEFCADGDYRRRLMGRRPEPSSLTAILGEFDQILAGLEVLHTRAIHRDLKPANVLVSGDVLKIGDFGLAKFVDEATRTLTFKGGGTPNYMAPEVWRRERATEATDLYAIGVMLYEALTGLLPFIGDMNILPDLHLHRPAPRARSITPWIPDLIDGAIKKLLAKDRKDRYQSAGELRTVLATAAPPAAARILSLADRIREQHDLAEAGQIEKDHARELAADSESRIRDKEVELLQLADEVAEDVNAQLSETRIDAANGVNSREYRFGPRTMFLRFFRPGQLYLDPVAPGRLEILRGRHLVHGGVIEIKGAGGGGSGWNVILVRPPDRSYGEWRLVSIRRASAESAAGVIQPCAAEARQLADHLACYWAGVAQPFTVSETALERNQLTGIFEAFLRVD